MTRLAVLTSHPIQYQAPLFRALAATPGVELTVLFGHRASGQDQAGAGFGVEFDWDIPLLDGYEHRFLRNVARVPSINRFNGIDTPDIRDLLRRFRYDAVMLMGWKHRSDWQAIWACKRAKIPVMARSDSHLKTRRPWPVRLTKEAVYRTFIPRLDACLAVGSWSAEYFRHYGASADRVFLVPHTVDAEYFSRRASALMPQRAEIRARWGLETGQVLFLFAGKFVPKKRPMDFVHGIEEAARADPRIAGLMVGDGALRPETEQYARGRRMPIRFAGFLNQTEMPSAYVSADCLVLPSDGAETWGLVVDEAMACGRPAVVSDLTGCGPDLVRTGRTGEIFVTGNVDELSSILVRLAGDPERLAAMGSEGRSLIMGRSISVAVDGILAAIERVRAAGRRPASNGGA